MASSNPLDAMQSAFKNAVAKVDDFKKKQPAPVMCLLEGLQGSTNGVLIGIVSHYFNQSLANSQVQNPNMSPDMKIQMEKMKASQPKTMLGSVRNFVALFGVQSALVAAFKHYRKDKDDVWNTVGPAFGAGAAFALASGTPEQVPAMAIGFAAFSGLFYQIGEWTGGNNAQPGSSAEDAYKVSYNMMTHLNLNRFHKRLKKGQLTDDTIMLWNNEVLKECDIPPGPRLLILHHLNAMRSSGKANRMLQPASPVEVPPGYQVGKQ